MNTQFLQLESDLSPQLFSQNKSTLQLTNAKLIISNKIIETTRSTTETYLSELTLPKSRHEM